MAINPATTDTVTIPQLDPLTLALETFLVGANADGKMGIFTANELATFLAPYISQIGSSGFVAVSGSVLPNPGVPSAFAFVGAGTFTKAGQPDVVTTDPINLLGWNGTIWSLLFGIPIDLKINKYVNGNYPTGSQRLLAGQMWDASVDIVSGEFPNQSPKWKPLIPTFNTNKAIGYNGTFANASTDWVAELGAPVFDVNTTIANKMSLKFSGVAQNERIALPGILEIGKYYRVSFKSALTAGASTTLRVGNFSTISGVFKIDIIPISTESEFSFVFKAAATGFNIGVLSANNNGSTYSISELSVIEMSSEDIKKLDLSDVKNFGATGNGIVDDLPAVNSLVTYLSENGFTQRSLRFKDGTFRLTNLININSFESLYLTGENSTIKVNISGAINRHLFSANAGGNVFINGLKIDINNDPLLLQAIRLITLTGTVSVINTNIYNYNNINQIGVYMQDVTKSPALAIANYLPSPLVSGCKFWNPQAVAITSYDYTNSTFKGTGIVLAANAEYVQILGCNFYGLSTGISSLNGANSTISTCIFEQCDPTQVAVDNGIINIPATAGNQGKLTISNCKFNHNFGYAIVSKYASADRGNIIIGNQFIVNSWTPIRIESGGNNLISGNIFNRNNEQQTLTGFPFTSGQGVGVQFVNSLRNSVRGNYFNQGMNYAVLSSGTSNKNAVCNNEHYLMTTSFTSMVGAGNFVNDNNDLV